MLKKDVDVSVNRKVIDFHQILVIKRESSTFGLKIPISKTVEIRMGLRTCERVAIVVIVG
jgi:hypothetical protein